MKHIYLSADREVGIFLVPDVVANDLETYCLQFLNWVHTSEEARKKYSIKYKDHEVLQYPDEAAFIDWLNTCVFPEENARFVSFAAEPISDEDTVPWFNF